MYFLQKELKGGNLKINYRYEGEFHWLRVNPFGETDRNINNQRPISVRPHPLFLWGGDGREGGYFSISLLWSFIILLCSIFYFNRKILAYPSFWRTQLAAAKLLFVFVLFVAVKKRIPSKICIRSCFVWLKSAQFNILCVFGRFQHSELLFFFTIVIDFSFFLFIFLSVPGEWSFFLFTIIYWNRIGSPPPHPRREAGDVWCLPPVWNLRAVIRFHFAISCLVLLPSLVTLSVLSFSACWPFLLNFFQKILQYFTLRDRLFCMAPV